MKTTLLHHLMIAALCVLLPLGLSAQVIPSVKKVVKTKEKLDLMGVSIRVDAESLKHEKEVLFSILEKHQVFSDAKGPSIFLSIGDVKMPTLESKYAEQLQEQAYQIIINEKKITITGQTPRAVFYAIQTFDQLIFEQSVPCQAITDWPDLPIRMLMVDPARQNENMDYYRSVIEFAARYKINAILCHLTDDQTSCLYHEDYPELMHPNAWRPEEIKDLVQYAKARYIDLIPEIESLGHSRMFTRRDDFKDFLHKTKTVKPKHGWTGTDMEGYTNVLCPSSDKATTYLKDMYQRASETFEHPWLHVGCDEVNMTQCDRCHSSLGDLTKEQWIRHSLMHCHDLAQKNGKRVGYWGDMLLHYPEVIDDLPTSSTVIFDWHYREDVSDESVKTFKEKGFEVIASPALVCWPHVILPEEHNYHNIERFTKIARDNDLLGVNTTIWIPTRYMSDAIWVGIGFAADQAWGGSTSTNQGYIKSFMTDYYHSDQGNDFYAVWKELTTVIWHMQDFQASAWDDDTSLEKARKIASERGSEIRLNLAKLKAAQNELELLGESVQQNKEQWVCFERSVALMQLSMERLLAAERVKQDGKWNQELLDSFSLRCDEAVQWIEEDWDKNRFADDPNKEGLYLNSHHILFQFKKMQYFSSDIE